MPKKILEESDIPEFAEHLNIATVRAALTAPVAPENADEEEILNVEERQHEVQELNEAVDRFADPALFATEDFRRLYHDELITMTDNNVFLGTVNAVNLDDHDWVMLGGVFFMRANDMKVLEAKLADTAKTLFGDEVELSEDDVTAILSCDDERFDALIAQAPADRHAYAVGVLSAVVQGYSIPDNSALGQYSNTLTADFTAARDAIDKLTEKSAAYVDVAFEKAEELEAEAASDEELREVVNDEDIEQLGKESEYYGQQDFLEYREITEEEYAANPGKYGEGIFIRNDAFTIPVGDDYEQDEFEFPTASQIRFGWRKISNWKDSSFDKAKNDDELIYNDGSARAVRASNLAVDDIKKQKVTLGMLKDELEILCAGCISREEVEEVIHRNKPAMLAGMFGSGDPRRAFRCFLDQRALSKGVYRFDPEKTRPFTEAFSEERRDKLTTEMLGTLPVRNRAGDTLRNIARWSESEEYDAEYSMSEILEGYHEKYNQEIQLNDKQKILIAKSILDMRDIRASRSFFWHLRHPIDSVKEYFQIVGAKRTAQNTFGIEAADFNLRDGRRRLAEKTIAVEAARQEAERRAAEEAKRIADEKEKQKQLAAQQKKEAEQKKAKEAAKEEVKEGKQPESEPVVNEIKEEVKQPESEPIVNEIKGDREPIDLDLKESQPSEKIPEEEKEPLEKKVDDPEREPEL